jgi:hypothetical protein
MGRRRPDEVRIGLGIERFTDTAGAVVHIEHFVRNAGQPAHNGASVGGNPTTERQARVLVDDHRPSLGDLQPLQLGITIGASFRSKTAGLPVLLV